LHVPEREPDNPLDIDFGVNYGVLVPELNPTVNPQLTAGRRVHQLLSIYSNKLIVISFRTQAVNNLK